MGQECGNGGKGGWGDTWQDPGCVNSPGSPSKGLLLGGFSANGEQQRASLVLWRGPHQEKLKSLRMVVDCQPALSPLERRSRLVLCFIHQRRTPSANKPSLALGVRFLMCLPEPRGPGLTTVLAQGLGGSGHPLVCHLASSGRRPRAQRGPTPGRLRSASRHRSSFAGGTGTLPCRFCHPLLPAAAAVPEVRPLLPAHLERKRG